MDETFEDDEKLFRAVLPPRVRPDFWKSKKRISSAALKTKIGLSADRAGGRQSCCALECIKGRMKIEGGVISLTFIQCCTVDSYVHYSPSHINIYHTDILGSNTSIMLSDKQAKILARNASVEFFAE